MERVKEGFREFRRGRPGMGILGLACSSGYIPAYKQTTQNCVHTAMRLHTRAGLSKACVCGAQFHSLADVGLSHTNLTAKEGKGP